MIKAATPCILGLISMLLWVNISLALTPNDPYFQDQWACYNDGSFSFFGLSAVAGADMDMTRAWDIELGDSSIIVAILDSGLDFDHPEFAGRIWRNPGEIPDNGIDDDGNGHVDDVVGYDFFNRDNNPSDDNGHGTAIAGILAANNNNEIGMAGIDWNCKLMICKITDSFGNSKESISAEAISYAVDNGAKFIVYALGLKKKNIFDSLTMAIQSAKKSNIIIISGSGNLNEDTINIPATDDHVICVGSVDPDDKRSTTFVGGEGGSNYGPELDIVAPGNGILIIDINTPGKYDTFVGGTSVATAYAAGVVSLLLAQDPTRTPDRIKQILYATAEDQVGDLEDTPSWDRYYGWGRINAYAALTYQEQPVINNLVIRDKSKPATPSLHITPFWGRVYVSASVKSEPVLFDILGKKVVYSKSPSRFK